MATKTILITGANGQLGHEMRNLIEADGSCRGIFTDRDELDITDARAVDAFFDAHREVDYLVNCAAFTAVDKAEDEPEHTKLHSQNNQIRNQNHYITHLSLSRRHLAAVGVWQHQARWRARAA